MLGECWRIRSGVGGAAVEADFIEFVRFCAFDSLPRLPEALRRWSNSFIKQHVLRAHRDEHSPCSFRTSESDNLIIIL